MGNYKSRISRSSVKGSSRDSCTVSTSSQLSSDTFSEPDSLKLVNPNVCFSDMLLALNRELDNLESKFLRKANLDDSQRHLLYELGSKFDWHIKQYDELRKIQKKVPDQSAANCNSQLDGIGDSENKFEHMEVETAIQNTKEEPKIAYEKLAEKQIEADTLRQQYDDLVNKFKEQTIAFSANRIQHKARSQQVKLLKERLDNLLNNKNTVRPTVNTPNEQELQALLEELEQLRTKNFELEGMLSERDHRIKDLELNVSTHKSNVQNIKLFNSKLGLQTVQSAKKYARRQSALNFADLPRENMKIVFEGKETSL